MDLFDSILQVVLILAKVGLVVGVLAILIRGYSYAKKEFLEWLRAELAERQKRRQDNDLLFTEWVAEKNNTPDPLF